MPQLGPSPMEAFQIGQNLNGPSALGQFAMAMTQRANQMKMFQAQTDIETNAKIRAAGPIAKAEAEAKAATNPFTPLIQSQMKGTTSGQPSDYVMTGFNSEGTANFESPSATGKIAGVKAASQLSAEQAAKVVPKGETFARNLKDMVQLARLIPAPEPGFKRPFQSVVLAYKGFTQEIPQVAQVERKRKAIAGQLVNLFSGESATRLSDQDVQRVLGLLSSPVGDTQAVRDLSNLSIIDGLNSIPELKADGGISYLDILTPQEIMRGREQQGKSGGKLLQDSSGATAIRYPDGTLEELH